ncbi:MAG: hypothetical protein AVDCRST_MAG89-2327 [uncultured Gemmatimonadetes bacterium]|uniref:Uncharacterized protein n=1 Tax=uncultured Gemmatimonadota bacterium TaxID=203437 RepID=A0A6J4LLG5_9BACT|nr:MAG: hypothetical protein AVDCRST_MAG89-2327 [uncultured Gemmatimonadota bacterium]
MCYIIHSKRTIFLFAEVSVSPIDLAAEMAAARKRRDDLTQRQLREARARAIRASVRPGSSRTEIEECARSFYPKLNPVLLEEAIELVCETPRDTVPLTTPVTG